MSLLYTITIYPVELIYKYIYLACISCVGSYGIGLILMSLVTFMVFIPLKKWAQKASKKEREIQDVLAPQIAKINIIWYNINIIMKGGVTMREFFKHLAIFVKWLVRVIIAVAALFLIGAAIAALYRETAPAMFTWFATMIQRIFG